MPITINDHCRSLEISGAAGCSLAKREPGMSQAPGQTSSSRAARRPLMSACTVMGTDGCPSVYYRPPRTPG
jgi:hypothetical protein